MSNNTGNRFGNRKRIGNRYNARIMKRPIDVKKFVSHLQTLKQEFKNRSNIAEKSGNWWQSAIQFEWQNVREANHESKWVSMVYTDQDGVKCYPTLRIHNEMHSGIIKPSNDEGLATLGTKFKGKPFIPLETRIGRPALQIKQWRVPVETEKDGLTIKTDIKGNPCLPADEHQSDFFMAIFLLNDIITSEISLMVERGEELTKYIRKSAESGNQNAQEILNSFHIQPISKNKFIIELGNLEKIQEAFSCPKAHEEVEYIQDRVLVVSRASIYPCIQKKISQKAKDNRGRFLPNPISRIPLNLREGEKKTNFFDKNRPYVEQGRRGFYPIAISEENVHEIILPGTMVTGLVSMNALCFSQAGVSLPIRGENLVLDCPSEDEEDDFDIIMGDGDDTLTNKDTYIYNSASQSKKTPENSCDISVVPKNKNHIDDEGYYSSNDTTVEYSGSAKSSAKKITNEEEQKSFLTSDEIDYEAILSGL